MAIKFLSAIDHGAYQLPTADGSNGQVLTTDGNGNVTFQSVAASSNYYLSGASFNTGTGVLTLTVSGATNQTVDLDGRYALSSHSHNYDNYGSWNLKTNGTQRTTVQSGGDLNLVAGSNVSLSYSAGGTVTITSTDTNTDTNDIDYINAASFNTGNGILSLTGVGNAGASVDLDGRYLPLSGGNMSGLITFQTASTSNGFYWNVNSDQAGINFKNTGDGDSNSFLNFFTKDNGNEYFKFSHRHYQTGGKDYMDVKDGIVRFNGDIRVNASQNGDWDAGTNYLSGGNLVWHDGDFSSTNISNWNTAYGWGNHASAGYITDGNTGWNNTYGFITASSTDTLTNKSGNISQWTNDAGYSTTSGTVTNVTVGTGLDVSSGTTTPNITLDLSEFADMTAAVDTAVDELILLDNGAERRKRFAEIFGSAAYQNTSAFDPAGSAASALADAINHTDDRIDNEVLPTFSGYLTTSGKAADSNLLDGIDSSAFLRSNTNDTFTGALTINGYIKGNGQQLILNAGETHSYATGQTSEYIYLNAEQGLEINSDTGNWSGGWAARKTAYLRGDQLTLDGETLSKTNIQNFKTAYGWGNHASAGYITSLSGYATTNYVDTAVSNLVDSAPGTLDTLNELAAALGDDPNFATTISNQIGTKLDATHDMTLTLNGDVSGAATFTNMGNATLTVVIADDSHNHTIANVDGLQTALNGKLSTTGKAADSNLLDGLDLHTGRNNQVNKVVRTDGNGYIQAGWINTTSGAAGTINKIYCSQDDYVRYLSPQNFRTQVTDSHYDAAGSAAAVDSRIDNEVLPAIPTNNNQLTNGAGYITGVPSSFTTSTINIGAKVTLTESSDRADLLYINSSTSSWGGLQIGNTSNEFIFSLMGDGTTGGIYDDQNSDWLIQWTENAGVRLYHNAGQKLTTTSTGITISGEIVTTGGNSTNWNTAYGWGNHASAGYLTSETYTAHENTSNLSGAYGGNNNGIVIEDITVDANGHVTAVGTRDLDSRFDAAGSAAAVDSRIDNEVLPAIPTNNNQLTNGAGYITGVPSSFTTSTINIGAKVTLTESSDRADLLYINSSTSSWGGLQIGNTSNEFIFSLMGDGTTGGIYDDQNSDWLIQWTENAGVRLYHNAGQKLTTTSTGITISGEIVTTGGNSTNWNTAYGWGNHASAGYLTSETYTAHENTSNLSGAYGGNNNGIVIEDITVDANGHVTAVGTRDLDSRFDAAGSAAAVDSRIDNEVIPSIPTNNNQLTNGAGYTTNVGDITGVTAGSGLTGGGTSGTVTVSHADTSTQSSVNNSGRTYIQDITLDNYGHITGITSATETVVNTDTNTVTSIRRDNTGTYRTGNINLVGGSNVTITETSAGVFSFASTDTNTNTTYSAGTGLTLSGTTFSLTTPITNNNQLTNGAGYVTSSGNTVIGTDSDINTSGYTIIDNLYMTDGVITSHGGRSLTNIHVEDTRAAEKSPNDYLDKSLSLDFTDEFASLGAWYSGMTVKGWSDNYTAWQLISSSNTSTNNELYFRTGTGTSWNSMYKVWHNGNLDAFVGASVSNDTITFTKANGGTVAVSTSDANTNYFLNGITRSGNTLTFSVSGTTNRTYTFGSAAWAATTDFDAAGSASTVNDRIDIEVIPSIPTNNNQLTNGAGYITSYTNTTYSADGNYGMTLSGTTFRLEDDRRRNSSTADIYTGNTHDFTWYDASVGIRWYTAGAEDMRLQDNGTLHVDGDVIAFSSTISDQTFKDDVVTIDNAIDKVKKLRGVEYTWNTGSRKGKRDLGLIAQEVEEVLPEIVHEHEMPLMEDAEAGKTYKTVDYEKMVGVLIEAMKEQQDIISQLEERIVDLENRM